MKIGFESPLKYKMVCFKWYIFCSYWYVCKKDIIPNVLWNNWEYLSKLITKWATTYQLYIVAELVVGLCVFYTTFNNIQMIYFN